VRTYNSRLQFESQEDFEKVLTFLKAQRDCVNAAYKTIFDLPKLSIIDLHAKFYHKYAKENNVPSQLIIRSQKEALGSYRSMKSNKHEKSIPEKTGLSARLDKRIYTLTGSSIRLTTLENRVNAKIELYPRLSEVWDKQDPCDPLIFERSGEIWISLSFKDNSPTVKPKLAVGIDLGVRRLVSTSEGNIFIDKEFNKRIRKIRFNKDQLKKKKTKSARRKSRKIGKKEVRMKKQMLNQLANAILQTTPANILVLEDLSKIKFKKKKRKQTKQTSFYAFRQILTYKAPYVGKQVVTVSPHYTSQIDSLSGKRVGERKGCRFYGVSVMDADLNAACNIAFRYSQSKIGNQLPVSWRTPLDGQAIVNSPNAFQSGSKELALQATAL